MTTFSPTFVLLQQEAYLAHGCLSTGLTELRNAVFPDKSAFYCGFFNTSIAFERIMKLIVVTDHMLRNSFSVPTISELKAYGHNLVTLYQSCVICSRRLSGKEIDMPQAGSIEAVILNFLSEFAKHSRYYNLDALSIQPSAYGEPLAGWEEILNMVVSQDVPRKKLNQEMERAAQLHNLVSEHMQAIQHGMDGRLLQMHEVFTLPVKHMLAVPYAMVRVFRLLDPLLKVINELGHRGFYGSPRDSGPMVPVFSEFFVYFGGSDAQIRKKKRWP